MHPPKEVGTLTEWIYTYMRHQGGRCSGRADCAIDDGDPQAGRCLNSSRKCFRDTASSAGVVFVDHRLALSLSLHVDPQDAAAAVLPRASTFTSFVCARSWSMDFQEDHLPHRTYFFCSARRARSRSFSVQCTCCAYAPHRSPLQHASRNRTPPRSQAFRAS